MSRGLYICPKVNWQFEVQAGSESSLREGGFQAASSANGVHHHAAGNATGLEFGFRWLCFVTVALPLQGFPVFFIPLKS
jgi:hypothetical protein